MAVGPVEYHRRPVGFPLYGPLAMSLRWVGNVSIRIFVRKEGCPVGGWPATGGGSAGPGPVGPIVGALPQVLAGCMPA